MTHDIYDVHLSNRGLRIRGPLEQAVANAIERFDGDGASRYEEFVALGAADADDVEGTLDALMDVGVIADPDHCETCTEQFARDTVLLELGIAMGRRLVSDGPPR